MESDLELDTRGEGVFISREREGKKRGRGRRGLEGMGERWKFGRV